MSNNFNIIFNSSHYDSVKKQFTYKLPVPTKFEKKKVALAYCSIYKQWENISADYGNNKFTIRWINNVDYTFTIPDGNYSISQINDFIEYSLYQNKLYYSATSSSEQIIVNINLVTNSTLYGSQLNIFPVPTSATATASSYVLPSGASWTWPSSVATNPTISFSESFGKLIGFSAGTYGSGSTTLSINSSLTPQIAVVNALLIQTNLLNVNYVNPPDVLTAISLDGEYGSLLKYQGQQLLYTPISANNFSEIAISFSDQNLNRLSIKDTEVCIILSIVDV